jgi:copper chaperone
MTSVTYQVTGMTCEHCARAVTGELASVAGVRTVTVDLVPGGRSAVTVTSDAPLPAAAVETALDEAGDYRLAR